MPQNQGTAPCSPRSQHTTTTTSAPLQWSHHGLRHGPPGINKLGLHWHRSNRRSTDTDGELPTLPKGYRLTGVGTYVFRARDLQTWCTGYYHHRPRHAIHQPILDLSLLSSEHQSPTLHRIPSTDQWPNVAPSSDHGTVPPSLLQLRTG